MPKKKKWFKAGKPLNWKSSDSQKTRRESALKSRSGKLLPAARALQALANVTKDKDTARKARADAIYFYAQHEKQKDRMK